MNFVAGITIVQALEHARRVAYNYNDTLLAVINDIVMIVYKGTDIQKALAEYHQKLKFRYEIEELKARMRKTK